MVRIATFIGAAAALYAGVTSAAPMPGMKMEDSMASSSAVADMSMATASSSYDSSSSSYDSSSGYGSSGYGSSGSSSNYGSSGSSSNYSSSSSSGKDMGSSSCSSSDCASSSNSSMDSMSSALTTEMAMSTDTAMAMSTDTAMAMSTDTAMAMSTESVMSSETTTAAASQYTTPMYGSGSSGYGSSGSSGYDSCVQQCVASYGMPSAMSMPSATASSDSSGSSSGATHTVYVAPTQGVLRYVPFAVNASVGDTVKFVWGGSPHTVTKSSILGICNKTSDAPFASGVQNKSFVFTQVVNDTNATFFYCGVATHCQQGMFGVMNPPNALGQPSSVDAMMPTIAANNSATAAAWAYTTNVTANNSAAASWGGAMDTSGMPDWAMSAMAENVMYTRAFLAVNPGALSEDGTVDLSRIAEGSIMNPPDVAALSAASSAPASSSSSGTAASGASASAGPAASAAGNAAASEPSTTSNGAGALSSPRVLVALAAVGAAFFAL